jgi:hypothetical protein
MLEESHGEASAHLVEMTSTAVPFSIALRLDALEILIRDLHPY